MTNAEMALAFALFGGFTVATGLIALSAFVGHQFGEFRERSREAARARAEHAARTEEGVAGVHRATLAVRDTLTMLEMMRASTERARILQTVTDRDAKNRRMRAARARQGRKR